MIRHAGWILLLALAGGILVVRGAIKVDETHDNRVSVWLPHGHEGTREYDWFVDLFGTDEVILVSWDGCTIDDRRLEQLASAVEQDRTIGDGTQSWVRSVVTGQRVAQALSQPPVELTISQITQRLQGVLFGPDRRTTCAILSLSELGNAHRGEVIDRLRALATGQCEIAPEALRLGGDVVSARAIDIEGDQAVSRWLLPSIVISFVVALISLRSWRTSLIVFLLAQYCSLGLESMIYHTGGKMNLLLTLAPVLIYVLALSTSVHLANYYRDALRESGDVRLAPWLAIRHGWRPCSLSALTTALGLFSLMVSHVPAVRSFGSYGAAGTITAFAFLIIVLPAAFARFPETSSRNTSRSRRWLFAVGLPTVSLRGAPLILPAFLGGLCVAGFGLGRIETSVSPLRFLPRHSRCLADSNWFREHIGPLAQYEVLIGLPRGDASELGARMRWVRDIQRSFHHLAPVRGSTSAATFAPPLGRTGRLSTVERARRAILDKQLAEARGQFIEQGYLADDGDREWWRITLRLDQIDRVDLTAFGREVRHVIDEAAVQSPWIPRERLRVVQTGTVPLFYVAQRELLNSLILSFVTALATITVVMVIALRGVVTGLLVMVPNVFPAILVFGIMGWSDVVVDVGSMMTASVALGIAVDDTLHYLTWYERSLRESGSRALALRSAFQTSAPAMLQTTAIAGLGLAVFALSDFQPVARFGALMSSLLVAAIIGDLLLLPAMLASPLGSPFSRRWERHRTTS